MKLPRILNLRIKTWLNSAYRFDSSCLARVVYPLGHHGNGPCGQPAVAFKVGINATGFCAGCDRKRHYNETIGFRLPDSISNEIIKDFEIEKIINS